MKTESSNLARRLVGPLPLCGILVWGSSISGCLTPNQGGNQSPTDGTVEPTTQSPTETETPPGSPSPDPLPSTPPDSPPVTTPPDLTPSLTTLPDLTPSLTTPPISPTPCVDEDGDGWCAPDDCDDSNSAVYPGAPEVCDEVDNNCDGKTGNSCWGSAKWGTSKW